MEDKRLLRLVKKARFGNKEAFGELIKEKSRKILFIATKLMGNSSDGEDAAQEAVITLAQKIDTLKKPELFDAWMYRIIFNVCMDEKRKKARKLDDSAEMDIAIATVAEKNAEVLPEKKLEQAASREAIMAALDELPERYRMCILLYYYEDMSYAAIAEVLQVSEQVVANTLNRAKEKLRTNYEINLERSGVESSDRADLLEHDDEEESKEFVGTAVKAGMFLPAMAITEALTTSESLTVLPGAVASLSTVAAGVTMPKGLILKRFMESVASKALAGAACVALVAGSAAYLSQNIPPVDSAVPIEKPAVPPAKAEPEKKVNPAHSARVEGLPEGSTTEILVEGENDAELRAFYNTIDQYEFQTSLDSEGFSYLLYRSAADETRYVLVIESAA